MQGRLRESKQTYAFFLDVQKAYDTVAYIACTKTTQLCYCCVYNIEYIICTLYNTCRALEGNSQGSLYETPEQFYRDNVNT